MKIGAKDTKEHVFLIAEIGNNHEGDLSLATDMIELAAEAGADAVKFQSIIPNRLVSALDNQRIQQLNGFQFFPKDFEKLAGVACEKGIAFMSTPFDISAVDFLDPIVPAFKVASGDNDFWPLIDRIVTTGKPVLISLGLGQLAKAKKLIKFISESAEKNEISVPEIALLHCVSSYPTPLEEAGLNAIHHLRGLECETGYSDHTLGILASEMAVAAGARIIEKHFTINKNHSSFRDHQLSADPEDLKLLVQSIRSIERMFGGDCLSAQNCEEENQVSLRRSISASADLPVGHLLKWDDLCWVRPQKGFKPGEENQIVGKKLKKSVSAGEAFSKDHFG